MPLLKDLVERGDVGIVLSTYWRHFTEYIAYVLTRFEIPSWRVMGATPGLGHLDGSCFDDQVYASRSEEICAWLQDHPEVSGFVILDDRRTAGLGVLAHHFVHCRQVSTGHDSCRYFEFGSESVATQHQERGRLDEGGRVVGAGDLAAAPC
ncbi:unnamed protein product [Durusdinium trenchii]